MKKWCFPLAVLAIMVPAINCGTSGPPAGTLDYQVLREWNPGGGVGMELLVSETATKADVLALADYLRSEYSRGTLFITIYDSRKAQNESLQGTLSDEEFFKHVLVSIARNPNTGYDKIEWLATERGY